MQQNILFLGMNKKYLYIIGVFFSIIILSVCSCQDGKTDEEKHLLHLTKNTLWDNPAYSELDVEDFYEYRKDVLGPSLVSYIERIDTMGISDEETVAFVDSLEKVDAPMKGLLLMYAFNYLQCTISEDALTKDTMLYFIRKGYEIAEKYENIPQSLFFCYWNNSIINLSNINEHDVIHKESQKLLRICQEQNIILGSIYSYYAIGYCLMDEGDYTMAQEQFEEADKVAEEFFPELIGQNWRKGDFTLSDMLSMYVGARLLELRCCIEGGDIDWIRKNEKELLELADKCEDNVDVGTVLSYMAMYYDKVGDVASCQKMLGRMSEQMKRWRIYEEKDENAVFHTICSFYFSAQIKRALSHNNPKEAMHYVDSLPDYFVNGRQDLMAQIYEGLGDKDKVLECLKKVNKSNEKRLNGHNRNTLRSMSAAVSDYNQQMQMMRQEMEHNRTRTLLIVIVLFLAIALVFALGIFLYGQKKHNTRLNHALTKAKMANHAKDIFLKNMNHEVHTPLNHIYGFAQLMADRSEALTENDAREMADAICQGSVQLTQILDNVVEVTDKISKLDKLEDMESVLKDIQNEND